MVSLEELPTELHCSIVRLLDPISLIAISQASTHFRCLIEPKQKHFVERLLALESLDKYGGTSPFFRSRDNHLSPGWDGKEWSTIRWACTDCFRLLPHQYFDNHSVLRLGYRKLIPGSLASIAITSWEPDEHIRRLRRHLRNGETQAASLSEKTLRKRYFVCVTAGEGSQGFVGVTSATTLELYKRCGISEFEGMSLAEFEKVTTAHKLQIFDKNALAIELERCGNKRRLRRCNECRYLRGQLKPRANGYGGTSKLPIVPSRQVAFANHLDRWFPGFSNWLESKRPTVALPLFRIYRKNAYDQPWTLYMVRCPGCACWKEIRDFRFGGIYPHWKPVTATGTRALSRQCHAPRRRLEDEWKRDLGQKPPRNAVLSDVNTLLTLAVGLSETYSIKTSHGLTVAAMPRFVISDVCVLSSLDWELALVRRQGLEAAASI
ncbi:hypothetical protein AUP68_16476 [Ilyonectria robusta]